MSLNKTQLLSNLGQEFAKQALTTQSAQGTAETNWPLIIGVGTLLCCCCLSCSALLGYLIYAASKKEGFDSYSYSVYPNVYEGEQGQQRRQREQGEQNQEVTDGSNELRNLIIFVLLGLLLLYLLRR